MKFSPAKMKASVEYLLAQQRIPAPGGLEALCRVLWYADYDAQRHYGASITGAFYSIRQGNPNTRSLAWAIEQLITEGVIAGGAADYLAYHQADFRLQRSRYDSLLEAREKTLLSSAFECVFGDSLGEGRYPSDDLRELALSQA